MTTPPVPGQVTQVSDWAVANRDGELRAVSRRCRHNLADLSRGSVGADGCLVCPWHGARYDLDSGAMVEGPHGLLFLHGRARAYGALVRLLTSVLPLRTRSARVDAAGQVVVEE